MPAGQVWDFVLFRIGGTPVSVATILTVGLVVLITLTASRIVRRTVDAAFARRGVAEPGTVAVVNRLLHYLILFVGLGVALQTAGIDLGTLFAAGAVFAVGIGFAMQNIAQNFVSGVILLVEGAIKPGDVLRVEGELVQVRELGIRATIVSTRDGQDIIVPNAKLVQSSVENFTLRESLVRVRVRVGLPYAAAPPRCREALEACGKQLAPEISGGRPAQVVLADFAESAVMWELAVWIDRPWDERVLRSVIHERIWSTLHSYGLKMAFPQLDLHLDRELQEALIRQAA